MSQKSEDQKVSLSTRFTIEHPDPGFIVKAQNEFLSWLDGLLDQGFTLVRNSCELETRIQHPRIETHKWIKITDSTMSKDIVQPGQEDPLGKKD